VGVTKFNNLKFILINNEIEKIHLFFYRKIPISRVVLLVCKFFLHLSHSAFFRRRFISKRLNNGVLVEQNNHCFPFSISLPGIVIHFFYNKLNHNLCQFHVTFRFSFFLFWKSILRNQKTEDSASFPRRRFHVEPGSREKAVRLNFIYY